MASTIWKVVLKLTDVQDINVPLKTVTESIYSGKAVIVPLADVQHIETHNPDGLIVVTKHSRVG